MTFDPHMPGLEGQAHLSELLSEVSHNLTSFGDVADHPLAKAALLNGERFLTDAGVMLADAASEDNLPAAEFEARIIEAIQHLSLAFVTRRLRDSGGQQLDDEQPIQPIDGLVSALRDMGLPLPPGAYEFRKVA
jgi:hypothetical protein